MTRAARVLLLALVAFCSRPATALEVVIPLSLQVVRSHVSTVLVDSLFAGSMTFETSIPGSSGAYEGALVSLSLSHEATGGSWTFGAGDVSVINDQPYVPGFIDALFVSSSMAVSVSTIAGSLVPTRLNLSFSAIGLTPRSVLGSDALPSSLPPFQAGSLVFLEDFAPPAIIIFSVPEPSLVGLWLASLGGMGWAAWRRLAVNPT